ncbi:MAG: hypothetical protein AAF730_09220 [Bacteroidota bacterium]
MTGTFHIGELLSDVLADLARRPAAPPVLAQKAADRSIESRQPSTSLSSARQPR